MGRITIEQYLIAARPDSSMNDSLFIDHVMDSILTRVIFSSVLRTTSEYHANNGGTFMNKLRTVPVGVLIALIIGATALTGGIAYAVYKTVIEPLRVEQSSSVIEDNKHKTTFTLQGCPSAEGVSGDEVTTVVNENSGITSVEARNYVIARCEQNAVIKYAHDAVAAKGISRYDSSVLNTQLPLAMPSASVSAIKTDIGQRTITPDTLFFKDGHLVNRNDIPEGSLVHVVYAGVPSKQDERSKDAVLAMIAASVDMKYYMALYESGALIQRVPCRNNPTESCLSDLPGKTFFSAITVDTGPVPTDEQKYTDAIRNNAFIEFGGVITRVEGGAFTFRTSTGRSVTFHLSESDMKRDRAPEQSLPVVGTEVIVTTIGNGRENISSADLLSAYVPILPN